MRVESHFFSRRGTGRFFAGLWAAVLLCGCSAGAPLLNSEQIEARYGSYDVRVLQQDEHIRVSSLASRHGEHWITRTLAITRFAAPHAAIAEETQLVRAGGSIGTTFKAAGWQIEKQTIYSGEFETALQMSVVERLMAIELPARLALHAYRFDVRRGGESHTFATIFELHHPDYISVAELQRRYGANTEHRSNKTASLLSLVANTLSALSLPADRAPRPPPVF